MTEAEVKQVFWEDFDRQVKEVLEDCDKKYNFSRKEIKELIEENDYLFDENIQLRKELLRLKTTVEKVEKIAKELLTDLEGSKSVG